MINNNKQSCLFCSIVNEQNKQIIIDSRYSFAIYDDFPVTLYHCLIIPKRHIEGFFSLTDEELLDIYSVIKQCKVNIIDRDKTVVGFNVGINIGEAAGQSIFHVHIHLIPRRIGDVTNPKGGVRGVIPNQQSY